MTLHSCFPPGRKTSREETLGIDNGHWRYGVKVLGEGSGEVDRGVRCSSGVNWGLGAFPSAKGG